MLRYYTLELVIVSYSSPNAISNTCNSIPIVNVGNGVGKDLKNSFLTCI